MLCMHIILVIPRAPPVIISSPVRLNDKDLIGILFKVISHAYTLFRNC